jgi:hypothetical protein
LVSVGLDGEGEATVAFLVLLLVVVTVTVLLMRSASRRGDAGGLRAPRPPRPRPGRPVAPDDDPEFLRELERRARRDDGSPT